jgi:hypothetical protein
VVAIFPNTNDERLNERIPVRLVPVGVVPTKVRRAAEGLITTHFGQTVEIPGLDEDVWNESALTRHDIAVDLVFKKFEIRSGKNKGQTRVDAFMPSGKRVELFTGGRAQRFGSRTPPLDVSVRCLVKFERLSKVLVIWTGQTTEKAEANAARVAPLTRLLQTGVIAAESRPALKDVFTALGINSDTATFRDARRAASALMEVEITSDEAALADSMVVVMLEAGYSFKPEDPKSTRARSEYIEDAKAAAIKAIRRRDEANARKPAEAGGDATSTAHDAGGNASAAAASDAPPTNGAHKPAWGHMGLPRLLEEAGELGVTVADDADKPAILAALEAKWLETHPQA